MSSNGMDCVKRPPPSVIAQLMGFEDQPLQQPIRKRQRVLSENYLQKTASLQISPKRFTSRRCSSKMEVDDDVIYNLKDMEKVWSMDQCRIAEYRNCVDVKQPSCLEYPYAYKPVQPTKDGPLKALLRPDSVFTSGFQDLRDTSLLPYYVKEIKLLKAYNFADDMMTKVCWNELKSQQKHKHIPLKPSKGRLSVDRSKQLLIYKGQQKKKPCLFSPLEKDKTSSVMSLSGNRKDVHILSPVKGTWINADTSLIRPRACCGTNWHLIAEEANKSTRFESRLHVSESSSLSIPFNSGPVCTNLNYASSMLLENESVKDRRSTESKISRSNQKNVFEESNEVYELFHVSSPCLDSGRLKDCVVSLSDQPPAVDNSSAGDFVSCSVAVIKMMAHTSQTEDGSGGTQIEGLHCAADDISQEGSDSLSEDSLATFQSPEPLSPTSSEEASRHSPISVLESFTKGRVPSTMSCYMNGSSDLYEMYSEGLGMTVSSDEDNRDESTYTIQDTAEPSDLSYLVSVLDEACGRCDVNNTAILPSLENLIDPKLFDVLEKKYGRQVSWPRSERKLLFDRINLGLKDIISSCIGIPQISSPIRKRVSPGWTKHEMKENLWRLLVSQDKEAMKAKELSPLKSKSSDIRKRKISNVVKAHGRQGFCR